MCIIVFDLVMNFKANDSIFIFFHLKKYSKKQTRNNFKIFFPLFTTGRLPTDLYLC